MINTRAIAAEYRLSHWAQVMQERMQSGLSIKAYCKQIGICGNTYFYWQRKVRAAACEQLALSVPEKSNLPAPGFTEVRVMEPAAPPALPEAPRTNRLRIEIGNIQMTADSTYPPDKLAGLLRELTRPC
jgi:transposase-like protein